MNQQNEQLFSIISTESSILDDVILNQNDFRKAINQKNWQNLMITTSKINSLMDKFNQLDSERDKMMQNSSVNLFDEKFNQQFTILRGKLVKCRTENKALQDYLVITRKFVKKVIDTSLPQSTNKVYTKTGVVQKSPQSILVDALF